MHATDHDRNAPGGTSDRRLYRRFGLSLPARLTLGGKTISCTIRDISLGGAKIAHEPLAEQASEVVLTPDLDNPGMTVPATIVASNGGCSHLRFELDMEREMDMTLFLMSLPETFVGDETDSSD